MPRIIISPRVFLKWINPFFRFKARRRKRMAWEWRVTLLRSYSLLQALSLSLSSVSSPYFRSPLSTSSLSLSLNPVSLPLLALVPSLSFFPSSYVYMLIQGHTHSRPRSTVSPTLCPSLLPPTPGGRGPSRSGHFFSELRATRIKRVQYLRDREPHLVKKQFRKSNKVQFKDII